MPSAGRPWWQQATALVSLGAGGAITGFSFVPRPAADLTSPSSMPVGLMALEQSAQPAQSGSGALRSAITNVANYYLRMAQTKTAAEMEAIIWQRDSLDGVDHGDSCAAFASLTLELGAHVVGQQSWVTGGGSYPWPLHKWADVRVNPNPGSPGVTSIVQDAQAHERWHPMDDGYQPEAGDWVVFDGHVEVVTKYAGGVLDTIGGDSVPNFSVNAHQYGDPLSAQGVVGFVDNGNLPTTTADLAPVAAGGQAAGQLGQEAMAIPGIVAANPPGNRPAVTAADAPIPGTPAAPGPGPRTAQSAGQPRQPGPPTRRQGQQADRHLAHLGRAREEAGAAAMPSSGVPGAYMSGAGAWTSEALADTAAIPGLPMMAHRLSGHLAAPATAPYRRHSPAPTPPPGQGTSAQQAFIGAVAPAAVAAQRKYGVPASVTIAQAIDESGWGQSHLAVNEHNLFGIKGTGPAGSYPQLTQEYENGQLVTTTGSFRAYRSAAQSVDDHGKLLATSGYYRQAMAVRGNPNAFAASLTGVYATDPDYGTKLISLMQQYDLYRYDTIAASAARSQAGGGPGTSAPATTPTRPAPGTPAAATSAPGAAIPGASVPGAQVPAAPAGGAPVPGGSAGGAPVPGGSAGGAPVPGGSAGGAPVPGGSAGGAPAAGAQLPAAPAGGASVPGAPAGGASVPGAPAPAAAMPGASGAAARAGRASSAAAPKAPARPPAGPPTVAPGIGSGAVASAHPARSAQARSSRPGGRPVTAAAPNRSVARTAAARRPTQGASAAQRPAPVAPARSRTTQGAPAARRAPSGRSTGSGAAPGTASIPGLAAPAPAASAQGTARAPSARAASTPGPRSGAPADRSPAPSTQAVSARLLAAEVNTRPRAATRPARATAEKYRPQIPPAVRSAYVTRAKDPLHLAEPLYRDVADHSGIGWQLLAACDWMQCRAGTRYSPVYGEKLGTVNGDGSAYRTKSGALEQCADELAALAWAVYGLDLAARRCLSVRDLANVFAAFRWGGLLRRHRTSAMEFPYSVAGLTAQHVKMRWPNIDHPNVPDKPGGRFRMPFGAVPVVLFLNYPATV
jgi:Mannosyl-glycoprotein endo-beta-N-acetylglucosaminidase